MADQKFTDLAAVTPPIDAGSLVAFSTYDGVSAYTSEKVTLTQLRDAVYLMEAEDKITFDSTGTNKDFVTDGTGSISFNAGTITVSTDNGNLLEGYMQLTPTSAVIGFDEDSPGSDIVFTASSAQISSSGVVRILCDGTGIGFFNATPVAQPSAYTLTATAVPSKTLLANASATAANNNSVIAQLVTDLQNLGLIA